MVTTATVIEGLDLDVKLLSNFIYELNISRRHVTAYPKDHPIIAASLDKALQILDQLLADQTEVTLGIARDTLIVGKGFLDKGNPIYRDLARLLFDHGIAAITFRKHLTRAELHAFNEILSRKREHLHDRGGIERVLLDAGIRQLEVKGIDYSSFHTTDEEQLTAPARELAAKQSPLLWEGFVHGLLEGTLDPGGERMALPGGMNPELLADIMNRQFEQNRPTRTVSYDHTMTAFMHQLDREELSSKCRSDSITKLTAFIGRLNPELRRQFLGSAFQPLATRMEFAEEVLERLPDQVLLDTLEDISARRSAIPPVIFNLLEKLSRNMAADGRTRAVDGPARGSSQGLAEKLRDIFREEERDKFVPPAYQQTLDQIVATERLDLLDPYEIEGLKATLASHCVEGQISAIILEIIGAGPTDQQEALQQNLLDLCGYFLEMGDFTALARIHDRLVSQDSATGQSAPLRDKVLTAFAMHEFVEEVINALGFWGKGKYPEITALIGKVGAPFTGPLLNRLAEEQSMSLRHCYMDLLLGMGPAGRDAALARLRDSRWYFIRNLVIILRRFNEPAVVHQLHRLTRHPHPRVRQEVLRTLLHFHDPEADRLLLQEMAGNDHERLLTAVQLAEKSRGPEVFHKLLELLHKGGLTDFDFELKSAVVHSLGEIGDPAALPELGRLFQAKSLLRPKMQHRLKAEIVRYMERYPADAVNGLLATLARESQDEVAQMAAEIRRNLQGREP